MLVLNRCKGNRFVPFREQCVISRDAYELGFAKRTTAIWREGPRYLLKREMRIVIVIHGRRKLASLDETTNPLAAQGVGSKLRLDVDTAHSPALWLATLMRVLVIGGGGREHALVWKLRQSRGVSKVWCAPGNGGISQDAECIPADLADTSGLAELAERLQANLTVIGPEQPLVNGIADEFDRRGLPIIAPSKQCAQLEGSKVFAKEFLDRYAIPTASLHGIFDSAEAAAENLEMLSYPLVLKADGLCGGKGVLVATSYSEAAEFVDRVLEKREFGEGGSSLLIEEALQGEELSFIVLSDGRHFIPLVPTRDHKRAFDGDLGPNTGGMGAYSCDGMIAPSVEAQILDGIVEPTMKALAQEGSVYRGFLYFGLMLTATGPKVLEFNCRLGDPEAQAIVARMDFDLGEVLSAAVEGRLVSQPLKWHSGASVCVVMASEGYPGKYATGREITGLEKAASLQDVSVFHAGTQRSGDIYYTSSGRVLGVAALAPSLDRARRTAYDAVHAVDFSGRQYRSDIALAACRVANAGDD
jgi:phosphoribosylamine--glycine ligase